jgi:hypothetical protein
MLTYYRASRSSHFPFGAVCSLSGSQPEIWSVSWNPPVHRIACRLFVVPLNVPASSQAKGEGAPGSSGPPGPLGPIRPEGPGSSRESREPPWPGRDPGRGWGDQEQVASPGRVSYGWSRVLKATRRAHGTLLYALGDRFPHTGLGAARSPCVSVRLLLIGRALKGRRCAARPPAQQRSLRSGASQTGRPGISPIEAAACWARGPGCCAAPA